MLYTLMDAFLTTLMRWEHDLILKVRDSGAQKLYNLPRISPLVWDSSPGQSDSRLYPNPTVYYTFPGLQLTPLTNAFEAHLRTQAWGVINFTDTKNPSELGWGATTPGHSQHLAQPGPYTLGPQTKGVPSSVSSSNSD